MPDPEKLLQDNASKILVPDAGRKERDILASIEAFENFSQATKKDHRSWRQTFGLKFSEGWIRMITLKPRAGLMAGVGVTAVAIGAFVTLNPAMFAPPQSLDETLITSPRTGDSIVANQRPSSARSAQPKTQGDMSELVIAEEIPAAPMMTDRISNNVVRDPAQYANPDLKALDQSAPSVTAVNSEDDFAEYETSGSYAVSDAPVATFSSDVDTASYSIARNYLHMGYLPPAQSIRPEEWVNYFHYDYDADPGQTFTAQTFLFDTPWNSQTKLLQIGVQGRGLESANRPPLNIVLLVDTSGSMRDYDKLPLLQRALTEFVDTLTPADSLAIVTYAGSAGVALEPTTGQHIGRMKAAIAALGAGGSTAGQAGLEAAYGLAQDMQEEGELSHVILATDGDFNIGASTPDELTEFISKQRDAGIGLSVHGYGSGNLDDAAMQAIAQAGNGQASYIDSYAEAYRVLVQNQLQALIPIATDLKFQIEFNPAIVQEYRLIGYETRALAREDFNNDAVDAGDVGVGHQVTALFEIVPAGGQGWVDPLRYEAANGQEPAGGSDELGYLKLRWKEPGASESTLIEQAVPNASVPAAEDQKFAAAIAGAAEIMRGSSFVAGWTLEDAQLLAQEGRGADPDGLRAQAISLMRYAASLQ